MASRIERLVAAAAVALSLGGCKGMGELFRGEDIEQKSPDITYAYRSGGQESPEKPVDLNNLSGKVRFELYRRKSNLVILNQYDDGVALVGALSLLPPMSAFMMAYPFSQFVMASIGCAPPGHALTEIHALGHNGLRVSRTSISKKWVYEQDTGYRGYTYKVSHTIIYDRDGNSIPDDDSFSADNLGLVQKPTTEDYERILVWALDQMHNHH